MPTIISNNLIGKIPVSKETVIRINLAWVSKEEARKIIDKSKHSIYLDYPDGRTKPPTPTITFEEAVELSKHKNVTYFAFSNATLNKVKDIKVKVNCILVPKIETEQGVKEVPDMIKEGIKTIMLDKEDLYTAVDCDPIKFNKLLDEVRSYKVNILELQGVVFI
jgi:hypothetical protein